MGGVTTTGVPASQAAACVRDALRGSGAETQAWPSRGAAYAALTVIILATMLNFLDAQVFGMMAQRIKVDFGLSDEQLGFLIGPANVTVTAGDLTVVYAEGAPASGTTASTLGVVTQTIPLAGSAVGVPTGTGGLLDHHGTPVWAVAVLIVAGLGLSASAFSLARSRA